MILSRKRSDFKILQLNAFTLLTILFQSLALAYLTCPWKILSLPRICRWQSSMACYRRRRCNGACCMYEHLFYWTLDFACQQTFWIESGVCDIFRVMYDCRSWWHLDLSLSLSFCVNIYSWSCMTGHELWIYRFLKGCYDRQPWHTQIGASLPRAETS